MAAPSHFTYLRKRISNNCKHYFLNDIFSYGMKSTVMYLLFVLFSFGVYSQSVQPGIYQSGLMIGYDEVNRKVTGVFEDASGWNEELKAPQFSCIFYVEGIVDGDTIPVVSYYPGEDDSDTITGTIVRLDAKTLLLRLDDDHGGCWNVSSFSNEPQLFELDQSHTWIQIRHVLKDKAWFYTYKSKSSKELFTPRFLHFLGF